MTIETERLTLRPFDNGDLDIVMKLYSDEEVMEYMPYPVMDREMAQNQLYKNLAGWETSPQIHYEMAVVCRESGEKIGRAEITRNYAEESAMIGWMLVRSAWGKGCATEIADALIAYCFDKLCLHRVYALCHPDNIASWKVMEKCGMRREAHYIRKCRYDKADGVRWEDELEYALLRSERMTGEAKSGRVQTPEENREQERQI